MNKQISARDVKNALECLHNSNKAVILQQFFKTGKGQYGEGDIFLGVVVPEQRKVAKTFAELLFPQISLLLKSPIHEHRLTALCILIHQYNKAMKTKDTQEKKRIVDLYIQHIQYINNWDLVDLSAPNILGEFCVQSSEKNSQDILSLIFSYAVSKNMWERRVAMVSTYAYIKRNDFSVPLSIAKLLVFDTHDLIQKAVGWMLREIGKRDEYIEVAFLTEYAPTMPRTTLRYAIEKFSDKKRKEFLTMKKYM